MRSLGMLQLAGGVVAAGVVAAGATAMTGMGVTRTGTAVDQWVGGTVVQTMTGTAFTGVTYTPLGGDATGTKVTTIAIAVNDPATSTPTRTLAITPGGNSYGQTSGTHAADRLKCGDGTHNSSWSGGVATITITAGTTSTVTCTVDNVDGDSVGGYVANLSTLTLDVS
jgi:hypothetical protein